MCPRRFEAGGGGEEGRTADLAMLVGAGSFQAASPIAKAKADLGLLYADGIHDALLRSAPSPPRATRSRRT